MGSSQAWEGHAELHQALEGLACAKGTSATRVKAVASAAFKYVKDYKRVVHDVEVFLWKADVEHRLAGADSIGILPPHVACVWYGIDGEGADCICWFLSIVYGCRADLPSEAGLYAMDAIIRQSQLKYGNKDQFTKRFSLHLSNTITAIKSIPPDAQQHVRHVVQEWQSRGFYLATQIEEAGGREYSINSSSSSKQTAPPHEQYGQREETTPTASAGKLASLLSIIKKQKELKDHQQESSSSILGDGPPQHHHHLPGHQSHNPAPLLPSPRASEHHLSPQKRASDNGYSHHRDAYDNEDRRRGAPPLLPEPLAAAALGGRARRDFDAGSNEEWHDLSRAAKKPRGSRWGPPKAVNAGDEMRPPPINTLSPRYTDDASRSPTRRPDFQPGPARATPTGLLHPPSGRTDEWPPPQQQRGDPLLSSSSSEPPVGSGRVGFGFERDAFHDNNRFAPPPTATPSAPPYGRPPPVVVGMVAPERHEDRSMTSPQHSGHNKTDDHSDKIPGTSGEICRKFAAGRCTFGDRCWHVHDPQGSTSLRPRPEFHETRRKTVLCKNFPRGTCRFGANCSFAHGEQDLDRLAPPKFRGGGASQDPAAYRDSSGSMSRWAGSRQESPVGGSKSDARALAPPALAHTPAGSLGSANAYDAHRVPPPVPPQQHQQEQHNRAFGTGMSPHPVLNEVQGDRGNNTGASSMSHHHHHPNGAPGVVAGSRPPNQQYPASVAIAVTTAASPNIPDRAPPGAKDTFVGGPPPRGPPGPSGSFVQVNSHGYSGPPPPSGMAPPPRSFSGTTGPPLPPPTSSAPRFPPLQLQQPPAVKTMPDTVSANPIDDDDEADSAAPEFTLQYDDED